MKPRNEEERRIVALHGQLPAITMEQTNWMLGQEYETEIAEFNAIKGRKHKIEKYEYYKIATTFKGWQVSRHFILHTEFSKKRGFYVYFLKEFSQRWMRIEPNTNKLSLHIFELRKGMNWYYRSQPYSITSELSLMSWDTGYGRGGRAYCSYARAGILPKASVLKQFREYKDVFVCEDEIEIVKAYRRNELGKYAQERKNERLKDFTHKKALTKMSYLPTKIETLMKIGEVSLAQACLGGQYGMMHYVYKYWQSLLIARRHGLTNQHWTDWNNWFNYLDDLQILKKDIYSPKYLCPPDLKRQMGLVSERAYIVTIADVENKKLEAEREKIKESYEPFIKAMSKFFPLHFESENLVFNPLKEPMEYLTEGKAMHHCVGGYYNRYSSLIISARTKNNERVETIEVSLNGYVIVQARGHCNKPSEYHDEVVEAVSAHLADIKALDKGKKPRAKKSARVVA